MEQLGQRVTGINPSTSHVIPSSFPTLGPTVETRIYEITLISLGFRSVADGKTPRTFIHFRNLSRNPQKLFTDLKNS